MLVGGDRQTNRKRQTTGRTIKTAGAERETHKENYRQSLQRNRRVKTCTHARAHTTTTTTKHTQPPNTRTHAHARARAHTHTHLRERAA